jgi:hypothetical protein
MDVPRMQAKEPVRSVADVLEEKKRGGSSMTIRNLNPKRPTVRNELQHIIAETFFDRSTSDADIRARLFKIRYFAQRALRSLSEVKA